jgi:hypothetical protein
LKWLHRQQYILKLLGTRRNIKKIVKTC